VAALLDQLEQALLDLVQVMRDMEARDVSQEGFQAGLDAFSKRWMNNAGPFPMRQLLYRVMKLVSEFVIEQSVRARHPR
jgi:hypothetical protein